MTRAAAAAVLLALAATTRAPAAEPAGPLDFVPDSAQLVVAVDDPRALAEAVAGLDAVRKAQQLGPVRQLVDTPAARRAFQMLGYVERELGATWPDLLDRTAGRGAALAVRYGDGTPVLLVVHGKDEAHAARAFDLAARLLDEELTRQGAKAALVRGTDGPAHTVRLGDDLHAARVGAAVLVSNKPDFLAEGRAAAAPGGKSVAARAALRDARKLLPKGPLAWLWLDFASVKRSKEAKDFFETTRKDFLQTLVLGSTLDCLARSEYVAAGLYREPAGFRLAVRLPAGRDGLPPEYVFHVPPAGTPGSLPLLEPPGVVYSQSFHLDVGFYWKNRAKLINEQMLKDIEDGERQISKVLPGQVKLGQLLEMWGGYHRLVVVNHDAPPYRTEPGLRLPAFGYVTAMRDPRFATTVEPLLRAAGVVGALQFGLKLTETTHDGVKVTAYRFPENKPLADDPDGIRYNFEPAFAVVGDQLVVASTVELCKKLIAEVRRTAELPGSPAVWRGKGYAAGAADLLTGLPDPLVTEAVLRDGVGLEAARKQVAELAAFVRTLGTARVEIDEAAREYRFDIVWEQK